MSLQDPQQEEPPRDPVTSGVYSRTLLPIVLALALVASLVVAGVLSARLRDQKDRSAQLEQQVLALSDRLEELRADIRGSGGSDSLAAIVASVSRLRGLSLEHRVQPELLSPAGLAARVDKLFKRDNTREELGAVADVLTTYGLLPPNYDLYTELLRLQEEGVAGFYDQNTGRLVVAASSARDPTAFDRVVLAHEYTHALTDQHYNLGKLNQLQKGGSDDAAAAYLALAEGDATYTMRLYQSEVLTAMEQEQFIEQATALPQTRFDAAPIYLREVIEFPYLQGVEFVTTLHDRGGFALVNQAYKDPPVSTEQILHPARYLDHRDDPVSIRLPDIGEALGGGWRSIESGEIGEYDVLELLDRGGGDGLSYADARAAADGWDGGQYGGFRSSDGVLVATLTQWDSESQAREATDAFVRWVRARYPGGSAFTGRGPGWRSEQGAGEVVRRGAAVMLILGPNQQDVEQAASAGF